MQIWFNLGPAQDVDTYHIYSIHFSHTQSMDVDEDSDQIY